ncbi:MAG: hypothetical protein HY744_09905 [Deltaproteobacteria bacterium]|nr:hypothetical protein [Deltaproteobacteria bacterium]
MSAVGAPTGRVSHVTVLGGSSMLVWGGTNGAGRLNTGGRYGLGEDEWHALSTEGPGNEPLVAREQHAAVWYDAMLLVFGGIGDVGNQLGVTLPTSAPESGGKLYDAAMDKWKSPSATDQPSARAGCSAVRSNLKPANQMTVIVWGGQDGNVFRDSGAQFSPSYNSWKPMGMPAPEARSGHGAVWLEGPARMAVWGGRGANGVLASGGLFDPKSNTWDKMTPLGPSAREGHTAVSTGKELIIWGGKAGDKVLGDGARLDPAKIQ